MADFHVFDTFAVGSNGRILHFDVVLDRKDSARALECARLWLESIEEKEAKITAESCCFCHSSGQAPDAVMAEIADRGYAIVKLEGCPK
jgi:hypothetical protein